MSTNVIRCTCGEGDATPLGLHAGYCALKGSRVISDAAALQPHGCRPNKVDCAVCSPELHVDCGCVDKAPKWSGVAQTDVTL